MSSRITLALLLVTYGCATSASCPDAHVPPIDAAPSLDAAVVDAPASDTSMGRPDAGAGCSGFEQLDFGVWLVTDLSTMSPYDGITATEPMHLEIRARGGTEPLVVQDGMYAYYFGTSQPLDPGDYELSASVGSYAAGSERWAPCDTTQPSCAVVPFTVDRCGAGVYVALFCDPSRGTCPAVTWPWGT